VHTLTVQSKFALGDRVRFNSPTQGCSGTGNINAIVIYACGRQDYMIELDQFESFEVQPGILEDEITLLGQNDSV